MGQMYIKMIISSALQQAFYSKKNTINILLIRVLKELLQNHYLKTSIYLNKGRTLRCHYEL